MERNRLTLIQSGQQAELINAESGLRAAAPQLPPSQAQPLPAAVRRRVMCLYFRPAPGAGAQGRLGKSWEVPLGPIAESCLRLSPRVALRPGEAVFVEIEPGRRQTEEGLVLRALLLCKRFRFAPRITVADDAPTALAMARVQCDSAKELPLEALLDYASPFERRNPGDPAAKRMGYVLLSLRGLGLKTLEDFTKLPPGSLVSRFGEEGQALGRDLREALTRPWPRFTPEERITEERDLREVDTQDACEDFSLVLNGLESVIDPAMARLRGRGLRAASVRVELELERRDGAAPMLRFWSLWLPVPQGTTRGVIPLLRDRMRFDIDRDPFRSGVVQIRFQVLETVRGRTSQGDLFQGSAEEGEAWDALLARMSAKLGHEHVFRARPVDRHLPERSWTRILPDALGRNELSARRAVHRAVSGSSQEPPPGAEASVDARVSLAPRPSRLLAHPLRLRRVGRVITALDDGRQWVIRESMGGERIAGEWWFHPSHQSYERSYSQVLTEEGQRLWTFVTPEGALFLHGFFD
ncbi:MAG: hypothetical protein IT285_00140 [Bdellovibrionales bacterium]|nr:hypothetical protein [Bdellovibrionales bacterium]